MGSCKGWTPEEDALLRLYYVEKGGEWEGWKVHLPGRSSKAIIEHARRIKLYRPRRRGADFELERPEVAAMADMHSGLAPSQIDEKRFWAPGRAHDLVVTAWIKDKESKWGLMGRR